MLKGASLSFVLLVITALPTIVLSSDNTVGLAQAQGANQTSTSTAGMNQNQSESIVPPNTVTNTTSSSSSSSTVSCNSANVTKSTISDIGELADALVAFRSSLSSEQLSQSSFELGNVEQYSWTNLPAGQGGDRGGIRFGDLDDNQLNLFYQAMDAFLSADGIEKVSLITKDIETILSQKNPDMWSPDYYHVAMFGDPAIDAVWGYQIDGHHLAINFLVCGDNVSIVPAFIGSEPASVNGTAVLGDERNLGFQLLQSLDEAQRTTAIQQGNRGLQVGPGQTTDDKIGFNYSVFEGIGLKASDMTPDQQEILRDLIKDYVYNMEAGFADKWMADVNATFNNTYFVWIGETSQDSPIYYRVYNPAVWIEYNNESGLGGTSNLDHIHTITRAPNGGDYGSLALHVGPETLLAHYAQANHHMFKEAPLDYTLVGLTSEGTNHEH
jgi:hypothetical protein